MNRADDFNEALELIEENLASEIDVNLLAKRLGVSVYEFRRIFAFVAGVPLGEYIRNRRLSVAAEELRAKKYTVTEVAMRYGYDAPSSFSRAFKDFHGVSPQAFLNGNAPLRAFTRLGFELQRKGGKELNAFLLEDEEFWIEGRTTISKLSDTECCEDAWSAFYEDGYGDALCRTEDRIYAVYENAENDVRCSIGARRNGDLKGKTGANVRVPACTWACFRLRGAEDDYVNKFYNETLFDWLASSTYKKRDGVPNLEVYPSDMSKADFEWEIRIPVEDK